MSKTEIELRLYDMFGDNNTKNIKVNIVNEVGVIYIRPEGTGDFYSETEGFPITLEIYEGVLRLLVYADINQELPTHIIPLEKALASNRADTNK